MLTQYQWFSPDFDAEIDTTVCNATTNCNLTLHMLVWLGRYNPGPKGGVVKDSNKVRRKVVQWKNSEWEMWKRKFQRQAQKFWNGRFWLLTPDHYRDFDWPKGAPTHRPNVFCRFRLRITPHASKAHHAIGCLRLHPEAGPFRSDAGTITHRDLKAEDYRGFGGGKKFKTNLHEVGHLLGLDHSAAHRRACKANPDTLVCYGKTKSEKLEVMGMGRRVEAYHAQPWRVAIAHLTGTADTEWGMSTKRVFPRKLKGVFPRHLKRVSLPRKL